MRWADISDWPNAALSRQITGPVHRWHVQEAGQGPTLVLLHGSGGSTHSFRDVLPLLAKRFHVIAIDLPGQGFTQLGARHRCGLTAMAQDIAALILQEGWHPAALIGHSSGGAVCLQMAQAGLFDGQPHVIGLNAALEEFSGLAGFLFPVMAKALAAMPFTASLFSGTAANPDRIRALLASTGSTLDPAGVELYRRLVSDRDHVNSTLLMMAQWNLKPLMSALPHHAGPVDFIVGSNDKTVPPRVSQRAASRMQDARLHVLDGLGHLAHEEDPHRVADLIEARLRDVAAG